MPRLNSPYTLIKKVFDVQHFSNIKESQYNGMKIINASSHGENYIFGVRNTMFFSQEDIDIIYQMSKKEHIHSIIIVTNSKASIKSDIWVKIKNYNIEVWDNEKLNSLLNESSSTLKTSDTSDDTCEIENESTDPIDNTPEVTGLFNNLFDKPTRL